MSKKKLKKPKTVETKNMSEQEIEAVAHELQDNLSDNKDYYVSPKAFSILIENFYKNGVLTDELVTMATKIAYRLAFKPNFINYSYRDDMIGDAVVKMIAALQHKKFNPVKAKGNPFSYFTKIAINAFRNRIKKEKKQHEAVVNYQEEMYNQLISDVYNQNKSKNATHSDYHGYDDYREI